WLFFPRGRGGIPWPALPWGGGGACHARSGSFSFFRFSGRLGRLSGLAAYRPSTICAVVFFLRVFFLRAFRFFRVPFVRNRPPPAPLPLCGRPFFSSAKPSPANPPSASSRKSPPW